MSETDAAARLREVLIKAESDGTRVWGNWEIVSLLLPVVRELQAEAWEEVLAEIHFTASLSKVAALASRRAAALRGHSA